MQRRGKRVVIALAILAMLTTTAAVYMGRETIRRGLLDWRGASARRPLPSGSLDRVTISAGAFDVVDLLNLLGGLTGLPVVYDSIDERFRNGKVELAAGMEHVDAETVRMMLEAHGYRVDVEDLPGGKQALRVTATR